MCTFFLGSANRLYVRLLLLYHEFEQFGSLHIGTPRKDFGRRGLEFRPQGTRTPRTLESTTRPMSYPGATNTNKIISNSIYNKNIIVFVVRYHVLSNMLKLVACILDLDVFLFIYNNYNCDSRHNNIFTRFPQDFHITVLDFTQHSYKTTSIVPSLLIHPSS